MAKYQVTTVRRPERWKPECTDDVPLELHGPVEVLAESDDLFEAVERAIEHNESETARQRGRWAVVLEPGSAGRRWPAARVCTPITYRVAAIWWPDGWEPDSPLDVPNCVWRSQERQCGQLMGYAEAEATAMALNRQCMDHPGTAWHVVVAIENEAISRTVSYDPSGVETTVEERRIHVIRPSDGGRGRCSSCPAGVFPCAKAAWSSQAQTLATSHSRAVRAAR